MLNPNENFGFDDYYYIGDPNDFDSKYAIDGTRFWHFLESTQEDEVNKLKHHGDWQLKILERLHKISKAKGLSSSPTQELIAEGVSVKLVFQPTSLFSRLMGGNIIPAFN